MATGLERTIVAKSCDLRYDWTIIVNPFQDLITMTEGVRTCWSDAGIKLVFPDFADATPPSNYKISYS